MRKEEAFPQPATTQPTNPDVCDFGEILEQFHTDFHRSDQSITEDEDAELFDVWQEIVANFMPHLTMTQWIKVLGELVVGAYCRCPIAAAQ
jgi:hypothetical protein